MLANTLLAASVLRGQVQNGIGALLNADRALIALPRRPEVGDSLNLDQAMQATHPQAHRWDYLLSVPHVGKIVGLEPHSARDDEISVVIAKKKASLHYIRAHLPPHRQISTWYWVSSGAVRFSRTERAARQLAQNGISFVGRMLRSFD